MPEIPDYYKHLADKAKERADEQAASAPEAPADEQAAGPPPRTAPPSRVPPPGAPPPRRTPPRQPPPTRVAPPAHLASRPPPEPDPAPDREALDGPLRPYAADAFTLVLPQEGWYDKTIFILTGPVADGLQHNVTVTLDPDLPAMTLSDYAMLQRQSIEAELSGVQVLLADEVTLDAGLPAARLIYRWYPTEGVRLYQQQLYVLHEGCGYKLTASFTKKTRKTVGPQVDRIMRSFVPQPAPEVAPER